MKPDLSMLLASAAATELMSLLADGEAVLALDVNFLGRAARAENLAAPRAHGVAVLRMHGSIKPRGYNSTEEFRQRLDTAMNNSDIGAIVLDVDSPGGAVAGTAETANAVRAAAKIKPVYAIADTLAASAAYWIASQASQLWVTPSGHVGSIGVIGMHMDISRMLDSAGVTPTIITAGKHKGEQSPFAPLSEDAQSHIQSMADQEHANFMRAVAEGRKVPVATVANDFGQGRIIAADQALKLGMVDRVGTMAELLSSLRTKGGTVRRRADFTF